VSQPAFTQAAAAPSLTRADIKARLSARQRGPARGDVTTAAKLLHAGGVQPFDEGRFGPITFMTQPPGNAPAPRRTPAAVLVPLVERSGGFTVLLTQRTADLKAHAGQISFPGGRLEPDDANAEAGALRETEEEIGLARAHVEVLGRLDPYLTVSGYEITPVVGAVTPPFDLKRDPIEVADIFEVPLGFFLDAANHQRHSRIANGTTRAYYAMPFGERYIWGATAGMLINLYDVLTGKA
jgi:8-oxo-dGTP pyrophosphatase MutT (NUDIX family)